MNKKQDALLKDVLRLAKLIQQDYPRSFTGWVLETKLYELEDLLDE